MPIVRMMSLISELLFSLFPYLAAAIEFYIDILFCFTVTVAGFVWRAQLIIDAMLTRLLGCSLRHLFCQTCIKFEVICS